MMMVGLNMFYALSHMTTRSMRRLVAHGRGADEVDQADFGERRLMSGKAS